MKLGTFLIYLFVCIASFVFGGILSEFFCPDNGLAPITFSIFTFVSIIFMRIINEEIKESN